MGSLSIFIKIDENKEKEIAKLAFFLKNRKKAEAFKEALLIASQNENFIKKYVNPIFEEDFKKVADEILKNEKEEK